MDLKKLDYITAPEEWIEDILEKSSKTSPSKAFWRKYGSIAAMIGFFLLCSTSVTVAAMKSTAFQTWLENIFGSGNVKEVVLTMPTALPGIIRFLSKKIRWLQGRKKALSVSIISWVMRNRSIRYIRLSRMD